MKDWPMTLQIRAAFLSPVRIDKSCIPEAEQSNMTGWPVGLPFHTSRRACTADWYKIGSLAVLARSSRRSLFTMVQMSRSVHEILSLPYRPAMSDRMKSVAVKLSIKNLQFQTKNRKDFDKST